MAFLTPLAFIAGLVIPVIVLLYMLKKRTRPKTVASIMLWQRLERTSTPALRLSKLLRNLLLALQILTAVLLVLALARPVLNVAGKAGRTTIVIIDTSMSMAVKEKGTTRLDLAANQVRTIISGKTPGDRVALIAMGEEAAVLSGFSTDGSALIRALNQAEINSARANPDAALALAENMARAEEGAEIILFSAGCFGSIVRPPDIPLEFIALGSAQVENLMVEDVVPDGDRLYVSIYNNGTQRANAEVEIRDDSGALLGRQEVDLEPDQRRVLVWRNLPASPWYRAVLSSSTDQLELDNEFYALAEDPAPGKLLLVSEGNLFLERALLLYPDLSISRVAPGDYSASMADLYDIFVLDGFLPAQLPRAPILVFDPPHPNSHFPTGAPVKISGVRPLPHPLLTHVDFGEVSIGFGKTLVGGSGILETEGGLLASEYDLGGQPLVVFGFAVQAGDLPLRPAFPILLRNILDRFAGTSQRLTLLKYGYPAPGGDTAVTRFSAGGIDEIPGGTVLRAGIYKLITQEEEQTGAVNPPLSTESVGARADLDSPAGPVAGRASATGGLSLLWPLIAAALILVGLEWWVDNYGS